jgi:protein-L-isoaspartate(D-aspartate) O-methyltransferase
MNVETARSQMLGQQIRAWDVLDNRVLAVLGEVPREEFVPADFRELAFADIEIPLQHDQCMMAPKIEGRLLQALELEPIDDVLEIGTGTGFLTACLSRLARSVTSVDIFEEFVGNAGRLLQTHGLRNVNLQTADALELGTGTRYDAIAITASLPELNEQFIRLLKPGGRLFVIVGREPAMDAQVIRLTATGDTVRESLFETVITPLIGSETPPPFRL